MGKNHEVVLLVVAFRRSGVQFCLWARLVGGGFQGTHAHTHTYITGRQGFHEAFSSISYIVSLNIVLFRHQLGGSEEVVAVMK